MRMDEQAPGRRAQVRLGAPLLISTGMHDGPAGWAQRAVVVSFTEFRAGRARDLVGIARGGLGLRLGWWAMEGALGVLLYLEPGRRRGGSLSVWETEADLRRFVALPRHRTIVGRYRGRVVVRSATWRTDHFDLAEAWAYGRERMGAAPSGAAGPGRRAADPAAREPSVPDPLTSHAPPS